MNSLRPAPASFPTTEPPSQQTLRRRAYRDQWLLLSNDPSFPLEPLRNIFVELCSAAAAPGNHAAFDAIERDVARTFGGTGMFDSQDARDRLRRVLAACAMRDPAVGYVQGLNFMAAFILMHVPDDADAFALLVRILDAPLYHMRGLYVHDLPDVAVTSYIIQHVLAKHLPLLAAHLDSVGCAPIFFFEWCEP